MQPVAAAAATPQQQQHALLFKPDGVLSQFVQNEALCHPGHLLLSDLQSTASLPLGTMAIGRLDQDSEGLLLLTTDGRLLPRCVDSSCWCGHSLGAAAEHPWLRAASGGPSRVPSAPRIDYRCSCPAHAALLYPPPGATMSQRAGKWRRSTTRRSWVRSTPPHCSSSLQARRDYVTGLWGPASSYI